MNFNIISNSKSLRFKIFISSIMEPDQYMIIGGNYELSIIEGAAKESWLEDLKLSGSYNESSFDREYNSIWSGDAENAFFSNDVFEKYRKCGKVNANASNLLVEISSMK